jgi:hypothetical protein
MTQFEDVQKALIFKAALLRLFPPSEGPLPFRSRRPGRDAIESPNNQRCILSDSSIMISSKIHTYMPRVLIYLHTEPFR